MRNLPKAIAVAVLFITTSTACFAQGWRNSSGTAGDQYHTTDTTQRGAEADRSIHDYCGNTANQKPRVRGGLPQAAYATLGFIPQISEFNDDVGSFNESPPILGEREPIGILPRDFAPPETIDDRYISPPARSPWSSEDNGFGPSGDGAGAGTMDRGLRPAGNLTPTPRTYGPGEYPYIETADGTRSYAHPRNLAPGVMFRCDRGFFDLKNPGAGWQDHPPR